MLKKARKELKYSGVSNAAHFLCKTENDIN